MDIERFIDGMASVIESHVVDDVPDKTWLQDGIEVRGDPFEAGVKFGKGLGKKVLFARFPTRRGKTTERDGIYIRQWPDKRFLVDVIVKQA